MCCEQALLISLVIRKKSHCHTVVAIASDDGSFFYLIHGQLWTSSDVTEGRSRLTGDSRYIGAVLG